ANTFCPGVVAAHKYRHIGAEREADLCQGVDIEAQLPEMVEAKQGRRRITGTTADTAALRQAFVQTQHGTTGATTVLLQGAGGAQDQVVIASGGIALHIQRERVSLGKVERVAVIKQCKHRLQKVIAVSATTGDMQEQVQFGRCRQRKRGDHGSDSQFFTIRVKRWSPWRARMRTGSCRPSTAP